MARNENLGGKFITLVERIRPIPPPPRHGPLKVAIRFPKKPDVSLEQGPVADMYEGVMDAFVKTYSPRDDSPVSEREVRHRFDRAIKIRWAQKAKDNLGVPPPSATAFDARLDTSRKG